MEGEELMEVLEELGELCEAELLYRRCLEAIERTLGKEHPDRWTVAGREICCAALDKGWGKNEGFNFSYFP